VNVVCSGCDRRVPAQNARAVTVHVLKTFDYACLPCYREWKTAGYLYQTNHPMAAEVMLAIAWKAR
jgi:hypothetical protein